MSILKGCRVLDLGIITAGAATSAILADLGADVIKIESPTYRDPFRIWVDGPPEADGLPPLFRATNRNKRGISIDLKQPAGRDVMLRLVASSNVVVENFRRGVLSNLGLSFETLAAANRKIVLASISSQGETGPDARHISYGSTLEAASGLAWGTGYAGDKPEVSGRDVNYPDQVVAIFAAGMIATALRSVRGGGDAVHLDLSQRDLTTFLFGEAFVSASAGEAIGRQGNAGEPHVLQDCFKAADGTWIAVTVDESDIAALATLLGVAPGEPASALHAVLSGYVGRRGSAAVVAAMDGAGLTVAPVLDGDGVLGLEHRSWEHALQRMDGMTVKGFPFQIDQAPLAIHRSAPQIGADTRDVLAAVGGYSDCEIAALVKAGVIEI